MGREVEAVANDSKGKCCSLSVIISKASWVTGVSH